MFTYLHRLVTLPLAISKTFNDFAAGHLTQDRPSGDSVALGVVSPGKHLRLFFDSVCLWVFYVWSKKNICPIGTFFLLI